MGLEPRSLGGLVGFSQQPDPFTNFVRHQREHVYRSLLRTNVAIPIVDLEARVMGDGLQYAPEYKAICEVIAAMTPLGSTGGELMHTAAIHVCKHPDLRVLLSIIAEKHGALVAGAVRRRGKTVEVHYVYKVLTNPEYFNNKTRTFVNEFNQTVPVLELYPRDLTSKYLNEESVKMLHDYREESAAAIARKRICPDAEDCNRDHIVQDEIDQFGLPVMVDGLLIRQVILCGLTRELMMAKTDLDLSMGFTEIAMLNKYIEEKTESYNAHAKLPEVASLERDVIRLINLGVATALATELGVHDSAMLPKPAVSVDYLAHLEEQVHNKLLFMRQHSFVKNVKQFGRLVGYTHDFMTHVENGFINQHTSQTIVDGFRSFGEPYGWLAAPLIGTSEVWVNRPRALTNRNFEADSSSREDPIIANDVAVETEDLRHKVDKLLDYLSSNRGINGVITALDKEGVLDAMVEFLQLPISRRFSKKTGGLKPYPCHLLTADSTLLAVISIYIDRANKREAFMFSSDDVVKEMVSLVARHRIRSAGTDAVLRSLREMEGEGFVSKIGNLWTITDKLSSLFLSLGLHLRNGHN